MDSTRGIAREGSGGGERPFPGLGPGLGPGLEPGARSPGRGSDGGPWTTIKSTCREVGVIPTLSRNCDRVVDPTLWPRPERAGRPGKAPIRESGDLPTRVISADARTTWHTRQGNDGPTPTCSASRPSPPHPAQHLAPHPPPHPPPAAPPRRDRPRVGRRPLRQVGARRASG